MVAVWWKTFPQPPIDFLGAGSVAGLAGQESRQNESSTHSVMLPALKDSLPGEVPIDTLLVLSLCKFAAMRVRYAPFVFSSPERVKKEKNLF